VKAGKVPSRAARRCPRGCGRSGWLLITVPGQKTGAYVCARCAHPQEIEENREASQLGLAGQAPQEIEVHDDVEHKACSSCSGSVFRLAFHSSPEMREESGPGARVAVLSCAKCSKDVAMVAVSMIGQQWRGVKDRRGR
jgi:hypothetical protein